MRDFVYVGESVPKIESPGHADFLLHMQKAMLLSLVKRKLLNVSQMEQVVEKIERKAFRPE